MEFEKLHEENENSLSRVFKEHEDLTDTRVHEPAISFNWTLEDLVYDFFRRRFPRFYKFFGKTIDFEIGGEEEISANRVSAYLKDRTGRSLICPTHQITKTWKDGVWQCLKCGKEKRIRWESIRAENADLQGQSTKDSTLASFF